MDNIFIIPHVDMFKFKNKPQIDLTHFPNFFEHCDDFTWFRFDELLLVVENRLKTIILDFGVEFSNNLLALACIVHGSYKNSSSRQRDSKSSFHTLLFLIGLFHPHILDE